MSSRCELIRGGAVAEVEVLDDTEVFKLVEVPIDRRDVDVGSRSLDLESELFCRVVPHAIEQAGNEQPTCRRNAVPFVAKPVEYLLEDG